VFAPGLFQAVQEVNRKRILGPLVHLTLPGSQLAQYGMRNVQKVVDIALGPAHVLHDHVDIVGIELAMHHDFIVRHSITVLAYIAPIIFLKHVCSTLDNSRDNIYNVLTMTIVIRAIITHVLGQI